MRDIITGFSKGYGFIEFESRSSVHDAVKNMNGRHIDEAEIIVDYEHERFIRILFSATIAHIIT